MAFSPTPRRILLGLSCALALCLGAPATAQTAPTVALSHLPGPLRDLYARTKPEMNEASRCAAAYDGGDADKMTLQCSVYMRLGAEAERRALRYCDERRVQMHIRSACAIVVE